MRNARQLHNSFVQHSDQFGLPYWSPTFDDRIAQPTKKKETIGLHFVPLYSFEDDNIPDILNGLFFDAAWKQNCKDLRDRSTRMWHAQFTFFYWMFVNVTSVEYIFKAYFSPSCEEDIFVIIEVINGNYFSSTIFDICRIIFFFYKEHYIVLLLILSNTCCLTRR